MERIFKNNHYSVIRDEKGEQKYLVSSKPTPTTLFKFYSLQERNIIALMNHQFWASEPEDFNDLFDSKAFLIDFLNIDLETARNLVENPIEKSLIEESWKSGLNFKFEVQKSHYSTIFSKLGIISMSSCFDNELLWALYAQNSGFCIELDYSIFPENFQGPFPMNYVDKLETIDIMKYGGHFSLLIQVTQKKKKWEFENEYRFIVKSGASPFKLSHSMYYKHTSQTEAVSRLVSYPPKAIIAVYLGFTFIKGESVNNHEVKLTSTEKILKARLLDDIIGQNLDCYIIEKETDGMILKRSKIEIVKLGSYKYLFAEKNE